MGPPSIAKWPNSKKSVFREQTKRREQKKHSQCQVSQFTLDGNIQFGEVQFYFLSKDDDEDGDQVAYAVISAYGPPNAQMLEESYQTLYACAYLGQESIICIPFTAIISVVSMQPLPCLEGDPENLWFVVEKPGLDDVQLFGYEDETI
ncbi:hypothetical protein BDZ97DRAFT_1763530 [Flammula alnicola]|nr:hypothetical protein BDZ97DRAFT_1763530 [Flammula alnicola]